MYLTVLASYCRESLLVEQLNLIEILVESSEECCSVVRSEFKTSLEIYPRDPPAFYLNELLHTQS